VAPGDPEALASALAELVDEESKREEMGRKGAEIVAMSFDVTVNAKELLSHFEQVAGL
jgi:glycosyltransferase involved in cell wall biosynthesis